MYNTTEDLLEKIRLGEDSTIEFKSVRFKGDKVDLSRNDIADEIAAFANTSEGVIILGINDKTKEIEGIPENKLDIVEAFIREISYDSINPSVMFRIIKMNIPDMIGALKSIIKIEISKSLFVHKSPGGYYRRIGSSKREIPPEELARLFQQRSQARIIRFDEQPVPNTKILDLDESLWRRFCGQTSEPNNVILEKAKIITKDDSGNFCLTVAGVLLCTLNPDSFLPNALIECVSYKGLNRDSNYQIDGQVVKGPLDKQIHDALNFTIRNMTVKAEKKPGRLDIPQYNIRAVFEAIVNAVAHRDYSIHGSKIRLFMFQNRLEIYSPGPIPNSLTVDSLHLRQSTRNELISSFLGRCKIDFDKNEIGRQSIMDKRGEGVPIIYEESENLSGKKPKYELIDEAELLLTIYSS
ncbi:MAG: putative DNA binding domain-containing protein [Spirochaetia bacterium]|nr:putative DNA binding domain-containing protein [Spirochaetia bacterium]